MLRTAISGVTIVLVAAALLLTIAVPAQWPMLAGALLLAIGCLFERRYQRGRPSDLTGFVTTAERFVDPETGRAMTVWADPLSGERRYVVEEALHASDA